MFLSIVPFLYSKRTAAARSLVSLIEKRTFCGAITRLYRAVELPYFTLPPAPWRRKKTREKTLQDTRR
jgi:hypothetical protein